MEASRSAGKGHGTGENQNGMLPVRTLDVVRKLYDRVQLSTVSPIVMLLFML